MSPVYGIYYTRQEIPSKNLKKVPLEYNPGKYGKPKPATQGACK